MPHYSQTTVSRLNLIISLVPRDYAFQPIKIYMWSVPSCFLAQISRESRGRKRGVSVNSCWGLSQSFIACQLFHQQLSRDFLILYQMWGDSPLAGAGTVIVWPWWCQPWSAAKLHLRLLQGPNSWVIQNAPQQGPSSILLLPSINVKMKLLSQNSGKGCKSASRWRVWVESRDFLKLWLDSEMSWSAAGEGNAAGSPTCPFVPPQVCFAVELWAGAVCGAHTATLVTRPSEQA